MKSSNDSLIMQFDALPSPEVNFGDINGWLNVELPHELNAGTGNKSYLWQDGSSGQFYTVVASGEYNVTVTGQNDCRTSKSVKVNMSTGIEKPVTMRCNYLQIPTRDYSHSQQMHVFQSVQHKIINSRVRQCMPKCTNQALNDAIDVQFLPWIILCVISIDKLIWQN
jgi:hypothetical protein